MKEQIMNVKVNTFIPKHPEELKKLIRHQYAVETYAYFCEQIKISPTTLSKMFARGHTTENIATRISNGLNKPIDDLFNRSSYTRVVKRYSNN